jgi:hypothetical protein
LYRLGRYAMNTARRPRPMAASVNISPIVARLPPRANPKGEQGRAGLGERERERVIPQGPVHRGVAHEHKDEPQGEHGEERDRRVEGHHRVAPGEVVTMVGEQPEHPTDHDEHEARQVQLEGSGDQEQPNGRPDRVEDERRPHDERDDIEDLHDRASLPLRPGEGGRAGRRRILALNLDLPAHLAGRP